MSITIAATTFERHHYDQRGDVLYLSVGPPREAARTIATPEGHAVDYDESGAVIYTWTTAETIKGMMEVEDELLRSEGIDPPWVPFTEAERAEAESLSA
jgi:uncharacterized protein YuzE